MLINKHKSVGSQNCNDSKVLIEYSSDANDNYENIEEYMSKKGRVLIVFDDMIVDLLSNIKLNLVIIQ